MSQDNAYDLQLLVNRVHKLPTNKQLEVMRFLETFLNKEENPVGAEAYLAEQKLRGTSIKLRYKDDSENLYIIKPAPAFGNNPDHLYITINGEYKGKVKDKSFTWVKQPTPGQIEVIKTLLENPKEMAMAYGKETGECSVCGKKLTNPDSIANGIGPICASQL